MNTISRLSRVAFSIVAAVLLGVGFLYMLTDIAAAAPCVDLTLVPHQGTTGGQVSALQQFLTGTGDFTYGSITGYFGSATEQAVQRFQCRQGIVCSGTPDSTGYGLLGPRTRAAMSCSALGTAPGLPYSPTTQSSTGQSQEESDVDEGLIKLMVEDRVIDTAPANLRTVDIPVDVPGETVGIVSCELAASAKRVKAGESVTLSWTAKGANTLTINNGVGPMDLAKEGSVTVVPPDPANGDSYTNVKYIATAQRKTSKGRVVDSKKCGVTIRVLAAPDTTDPIPPTVRFKKGVPVNGSTVGGSVALSVNVEDNIGVESVWFEVDDVQIGTQKTEEPFTLNWDTTTVENGPHNFRAFARDVSGNVSHTGYRNVTVSNAPAVSYIIDPEYQDGVDVRKAARDLVTCKPVIETTLYPFGEGTAPQMWTVGQWFGRYPFTAENAKPKELKNGAVEYTTPGKRLVFGPGNAVTLGVNATVDRGLWEVPCRGFSKNGKIKSLFTVNPTEPDETLTTSLADMQSVRYKLSFRLTKGYFGDDFPGQVAHASANLVLINRNKESAGKGQFVFFILKLYDSRNRTIEAHVGKDGSSGMLLYRIASQDLYGDQSAWDQKWITIDKDLKPYFKDAIETAAKRGLVTSTDLNDYYLSFEGPHWEITAPVDVEMEFKDFDIQVTPKQ